MNKEVMRYNSHPITPREKLWVENFHAHETPSSLNLADDYINFLRPGETVLEVGCAYGRIANLLADEKKVKVTGIDINEAEINYAKDNCASKMVNFIGMNGTRLKCTNDSFNHVVMVGVLGAVEPEEREKLLEQAHRVLISGGTVAIAEFKMNLGDDEQIEKYKRDKDITEEWGSRIVRKGGKILFIGRHFTKEELIELLSDAGFSSIQSREQPIASVGVGDGEMKTRTQYTVWGIKPSNKEAKK